MYRWIKRIPYRMILVCSLFFFGGLNYEGNAVLFMGLSYIFIIMFSKRIPIRKEGILIVALYISIVLGILINKSESLTLLIVKFLLYPLAFLAFSCLGNFIKEKSNPNHIVQCFYIFMFMFALGNFAHIMLDVNISNIASINIGRRVITDIWTHGQSPTTIIIGWGCFLPALFCYGLDHIRDRLLLFIVSTFAFVVYIALGFMTSTRLGIVNGIFIMLIYAFMKVRDKEIQTSLVMKICPLVLAAFFVIDRLIPLILNSNLAQRLASESGGFFKSNGRIEATMYLISHFFDHMLGGDFFSQEYGLQQHNIVFQLYDSYGIFSFVFIVVLLSILLIQIYRIWKHRTDLVQGEARFIVLCFIALMLYLFEEPALTSNFIITTTLFSFAGVYLPIDNARRNN